MAARKNLPYLQGRGTGLKAGGGVLPTTAPLPQRHFRKKRF